MAIRCTHLDPVRPVVCTPDGREEWLESSFQVGVVRVWCYPDALPLRRSTIEGALGGSGGERS